MACASLVASETPITTTTTPLHRILVRTLLLLVTWFRWSHRCPSTPWPGLDSFLCLSCQNGPRSPGHLAWKLNPHPQQRHAPRALPSL